jgi:hypothetical protein
MKNASFETRPRGYPNCVALVLELQCRLTLRERCAFFRRLHQRSRELGLVFSHKYGACVFFGAERPCGSVHRHALTNWLSDQHEVRAVHLGQLGNLSALARHADALPPDMPFTQGERQAGRLVFGLLVLRVAYQWLRFIEGRIK